MTFMKARVKKSWRRWVRAILLLLAIGFAGLNFLAYRQGGAMMHFQRDGTRTRAPEALSVWQKLRVLVCGVNIPRPHGQGNPSSVGLPFREVVIPGTNGIRLGGWFCPRKEAETLVVQFHGYAADKSRLLAEARQFHELGCAVLLVDFRGSGQSSEDVTTVGYAEAEDVAAVAAYAREQWPGLRQVFFGQSMGAAAVLRAVSRCGVRPDAVILEAVFDTMSNTVRHRFTAMRLPSFPAAELLIFWGGWQMGFNGFEHNPVAYARDVTCPALVMHGGGDTRAYLQDGRRVFDQLRGPKTFVEFAATGHEPYVRRRREEWRNAVHALLAQVAAPLPAGR
jgi:alpha-beta hydrolase superfamily lysophospholipase